MDNKKIADWLVAHKRDICIVVVTALVVNKLTVRSVGKAYMKVQRNADGTYTVNA